MIIDIVLFLFALAGFWLGYTRGVVGTLIMIAAYTGAVLLTLKISPLLMNFLTGTFNMEKLFALIFGTIFILLMLIILIHLVARRISASIKKGKLSSSNKIIGGIVMFMVGILFYSMLLWPINQFGMMGEHSKQSSLTYKTLEPIPLKARGLAASLRPVFNEYWKLIEETIHEKQSGSAQ